MSDYKKDNELWTKEKAVVPKKALDKFCNTLLQKFSLESCQTYLK